MSLLSHLDPGGLAVWTILSSLLQITVVIVMAALVAGVGLRRRAAARHLLWLGALISILLSPLLAELARRAGPRLVELPILASDSERLDSARLPAPHETSTWERRLTSEVVRGNEPAGLQQGQVEGERAGDARPDPAVQADSVDVDSRPSWPDGVVSSASRRRGDWVVGGLVALWGSGSLIGLGRLIVGWRQVTCLTRSARVLDLDRFHDSVAAARVVLGVGTLPRVMMSSRIVAPVAVGLLRPCVLLPEGLAESVSAEALRDILVHESAHLLRRDPWVGLLQRLASAFFWPHPLVHYLNGQLTRAREEVCDNHVLQLGDACGYARVLLSLTERCHARANLLTSTGLGLLGARWTLTERVAGLLDPGRPLGTTTNVGAKVALTVALAVTVLSTASVRLVASGQGTELASTTSPRVATPEASELEPAWIGVWRIRGVVVDERGHPVAGAVVRPPASMDNLGITGGTTAADGHFTIHFTGRHQLCRGLVALADRGRRVGLSSNAQPFTDRTDTPVQIVVKATRQLTVRVNDPTGAPIAGAAVEAVESKYQTDARTGPDGVASLRVAADAQIQWVVAQKQGAGLNYFENYQPTRPNEFPPLPREIELTLDGARPIRIKAIDTQGRPVPGVRMSPQLLKRRGKFDAVHAALASTSWVTTDEHGLAVFDTLHEDVGGCSFAVRSDSYLCPREPNSERDGPTDLTVRLFKPTRLSGKVMFPDGRPARNVIVRAEGILPLALGSDWLARTGADGTYALQVVPERVYMLAIDDDEWAAPTRTQVVVHENKPYSGLDFTLGQGTVVQGQVTEGPDRKPVTGANVALIEEGPLLPKEFRRVLRSGRLTRWAIADSQGKYQFRLSPGRYTLRLGSGVSQRLEVRDQPKLVRDLSLKAEERVTFMTVAVVEQTASGLRPVPRATVTTLSSGGGRSAQKPTDELGRVRIVRRANALLFVRSDDGRLSACFPVSDLPEPKNAGPAEEVVTVVVSPAARISGSVLDTDGRAQAKSRLLVRLNFDSRPDGVYSIQEVAHSDEKGRFVYAGIPAGTIGEVAAFHEREGRQTGARTVVPFRVDEPEPIAVPDVVIPTVRPKKQAPRIEG